MKRTTTTHNVFGIRCKSDLGAFGMLIAKHICDDVGIFDRSHGRKPIVFRFTGIYLLAIIFDRLFRAFEFRAATRQIVISPIKT